MKRHYAGAWIEAVYHAPAGQVIGRLRKQGYSWRQVARELNISHATAQREHRRYVVKLERGKERGQPTAA